MRSKNEPYSLQTALFLVFDEWLNTRMQYALWNCGIDTNLKTYHYYNTYYTTYTRLLNMATKSSYRKLIALSQILQCVSDATVDDEIQMTETMAVMKDNKEELQRFIIREIFQLLDSVDGVAKLKPALYPCERIKI
ncbi:unnamed protein product [Rotaria sordida]|uniref:Uncharacterized protein n=1 Tax=Rotaria sordida TaxID=392033 RepID=A0A815NVK3_9BILA|nr:unnamed protein product [Rotaria sordida]CAF4054342.1 unnamed protein product [Rotaria sordida]